MKISLLIWRWWCFSCQHIQRIDIQYTDQFVLKNNSLGIADIIFINKLQFLTFSFSNLRNLLKCIGSMFPCYSLLNMKVIWLHMVSAIPPITMVRLNLKICRNFVVAKFFLTFVAGIWMHQLLLANILKLKFPF